MVLRSLKTGEENDPSHVILNVSSGRHLYTSLKNGYVQGPRTVVTTFETERMIAFINFHKADLSFHLFH